MIDEAYELVQKFQEMAGQPIGTSPVFLEQQRCEIRSKWMREEIEEFEAGSTVYEQADAMIDLLYYAIGALVEMGVKPDQLFMLVHEYNIKKLSDKRCNEDGKVLKPRQWHHPDEEIRQIIDRMKEESRCGR